MLFNIEFADNTILLCFFIFFLIIELYFLIPTAIVQLFELLIPIGIPNKEAKAEIPIHPVIAKAKIRSVQYNLELYKPFCTFYSSIHFALFLQGNSFLFHP